MGGRCAIHAPSCGRQMCLLLLVTLLPPQAWPLLIKVYWAIQYRMRYASAFASLTFLFPTGTLWALGAFLGGQACGLGMLFYWICPLVTPTPTLLQLGLLLPLSARHLTYPFGLVCFFSSPPAIHLPIWLGLLLPLSTCHSLTHSPPPGLAVLHSHQALKG